MAELSPEARLQSRKFETEALRRIADVQYDALSVAMGCDKSTVSRMLGERGIKLAEIPLLLGALGWKIVGRDQQCMDRELYLAFRTIAQRALNAPTLQWDEPADEGAS